MKIVIIYEDGEIFVQLSPDEFKAELKKYLDGDIDKAIENIIRDLKKKTLVV